MTTQFTAEVFQNQFLTQGSREVHAIMTVNAGEATETSTRVSGEQLFGIICDTSGSMGGQKIRSAKDAMIKAVNMLPEAAHFFIVTGASQARLVVPLTQATADSKQQAIANIRSIESSGGTLISTWLSAALKQFQQMPTAIRQALLLTDGQNDESGRFKPAKGCFNATVEESELTGALDNLN